jgi:hypothetical protein
MQPLVYAFLSMKNEREKGRALRPFQVREGLVFALILSGLRHHGFELGDVKLNFPPPHGFGRVQAHIDTTMCLSHDLIVTVTRPPLSDDSQGPRKRVPRGYTDLEDEILSAWKQFMPILSRDHCQLSETLGARLGGNDADRWDLEFREKPGAPYKKMRALGSTRQHSTPRDETRTAAFLLRLPLLPGRNVGYLGIWGLDGISTEIWAYQLLRRHCEWLATPGFLFAELAGGPIPTRPTDLHWALDWDVRTVLHLPLRERVRKVQSADTANDARASGREHA